MQVSKELPDFVNMIGGRERPESLIGWPMAISPTTHTLSHQCMQIHTRTCTPATPTSTQHTSCGAE